MNADARPPGPPPPAGLVARMARRWPLVPVALQFARYGLCGLAATGVDMAVFYAVAWKVIPALTEADPFVRALGLAGPFVEEASRSRNFVVDRIIAFLFSNLTAYLLNVRWVFTPGRHRRHLEVALFYVVSIVSVGIGTAVGWALIRFLGMSTTVSYVTNMVACTLINFAGRKFVVFKG